MEFWIDVTDPAGVAYGSGPILTATRWVGNAKLDRAGTFTFDMPATDPKSLNLADERYVYCYGILDGAITQLGAGIIRKIGLQVRTSGAPMITVSGEDLLSELAGYTVGYLEVYQVSDTLSTPDTAYYLDTRAVPSTDTEMTNALDGNPATFDTFHLYQYRQTYVYVGHTTRYSAIQWDLTTPQVQTDGDTLGGEYYSESTGWTDVAGLVDGTDDGSNTMRQSGLVTYDRPDDWVTTSHHEKERYWTRWRCANDQITDYIDVNRIRIYAEEPSDTPISDVMAYAPAGWTVTDAEGMELETSTPVLAEFAGQSVLAALIRIAEITGEHFRIGTGRTLVWLDALYSSGIYAIR